MFHTCTILQAAACVGRQFSKSVRERRVFGASWKIHGTNVYGRSRSQVSGNDVMHDEMYIIRLRRRAVS